MPESTDEQLDRHERELRALRDRLNRVEESIGIRHIDPSGIPTDSPEPNPRDGFDRPDGH